MTFFNDTVQNLFIEGVYTARRGKPNITYIFCPDCQITFFEGNTGTDESRISLLAAEQIAHQHAELCGHVICRASPEKFM